MSYYVGEELKYILLTFLFIMDCYSSDCSKDPLGTYLKSLPTQSLDNVAFSNLDQIIKKGFESEQGKKFDYVVVLGTKSTGKIFGISKKQLLTNSFDGEKYDPKVTKEVTKILGITEKEALIRSGDPFGTTSCSDKHLQGDIANRWCHAKVINALDNALSSTGLVEKYAANLLAATVFLPKEYIIDKNPSKSDLVISSFPLYDNKKGKSSTKVTIFGDGLFYIQFDKKF